MRRNWPILVWLVIVWVALWEQLSWGNIIAGLFLGGLILTAFRTHSAPRTGTLRPLAAAWFLVYFAWKLLEASAVVAWEVITPGTRINEGIVAVPVLGASNVLVTMVANAISLTPGTLTIEVDRNPPVLYIHVLHLRDVEEVRRDVQHLELLAIRAFGSAEALQAATATPPREAAAESTPRRRGRFERRNPR